MLPKLEVESGDHCCPTSIFLAGALEVPAEFVKYRDQSLMPFAHVGHCDKVLWAGWLINSRNLQSSEVRAPASGFW